ncbi:hypothetical protein NLJ89_g11875 [Agrocybe chaxingu]|uniref:Uncharacterized protein n=1 Tax=Agrocybe chaxingu TaxID=84603 RepID=A0A9W8MQS5_9AGAR|nr:hypothetical protein NLJ89_g11875 [Agrocybe chaxingu]
MYDLRLRNNVFPPTTSNGQKRIQATGGANFTIRRGRAAAAASPGGTTARGSHTDLLFDGFFGGGRRGGRFDPYDSFGLGGDVDCFAPVSDRTKGALENVKTRKSLLNADCGLASTRRKPFTLFRHVPLLSDLHLNRYYLVDVSVSWAQLTSLTLQHVYLDECFYALSRTPDLMYCQLYPILKNDIEREVHDTEVRLDELEQIVIYRALWHDTAYGVGADQDEKMRKELIHDPSSIKALEILLETTSIEEMPMEFQQA